MNSLRHLKESKIDVVGNAGPVDSVTTAISSGAGILNASNSPSDEELKDIDDLNNLLDELGPRFKDWSGCDPLPVDADMLPCVLPTYKPPFRLLPSGVRPCLGNKDMTMYRRHARTMPPHFALGRNRELQGLAMAMVKLWKKSAVAKIAIKRGVLNTSSERMAEEIKIHINWYQSRVHIPGVASFKSKMSRGKPVMKKPTLTQDGARISDKLDKLVEAFGKGAFFQSPNYLCWVRFEENEEWGCDDSFGSNDEHISAIEKEFVIEAETCDVEEIGVQPKANRPATTTTDQPRGSRLETTSECNQQGLPTPTPTSFPIVVGTTTVPVALAKANFLAWIHLRDWKREPEEEEPSIESGERKECDTIQTVTTYHLGETTPAVHAVHMLHEQQPAPVVSTVKRLSRVEQSSASSAVTTNQRATQQWIQEICINHKMHIDLVQQFHSRMLQSENSKFEDGYAISESFEFRDVSKTCRFRGRNLLQREGFDVNCSLMKLTGGTLVSRNKDYIVFYRGNDFLSLAVTDVLVNRHKLVELQQVEEEKARQRASSALIVSNAKSSKGPLVAGTLAETMAANSRWGNQPSSEEIEKMRRDFSLARHASLVRYLEKKLTHAQEKVRKAEKALRKVQENLSPKDLPTDIETISDEERFLFRKMGLSMKPFLLLGRRGVFDGTVENMHLHWKYRELVKIIVKRKSYSLVKHIAISLEAESGGLLISVDKTMKGYEIIIYRGKNYQRPQAIKPDNLLTRRQALTRSVELQRREALNHHILDLLERIELLKSELDQVEAVKETGDDKLYTRLNGAYLSEDDFEDEDEDEDAYLKTYNKDDDIDKEEEDIHGFRSSPGREIPRETVKGQR
ncbi:hypothetical protein GIB67_017849 [Kingdonia uniflora]|uniref:CRM domain-containing protein n=1 Tax=Kingdonia uniflora TaxID=39325 RepID=A0A7J7NU70_9MAGN|nr:hypothetical protein GIB67_017849 [Kingdonia uniflora]